MRNIGQNANKRNTSFIEIAWSEAAWAWPFQNYVNLLIQRNLYKGTEKHFKFLSKNR